MGAEIKLRGDRPLYMDLPVVVVDDDALMREEIAGLLADVGYISRAYDSGDNFLQAEPDLAGVLVVDLRLKGMSGLMVQRKLACRPQLEIIFISGVADVDDAVLAMKAGAHEFLVKPFRPQALIESVGGAFEKLEGSRQSGMQAEEVRSAYSTLTETERDIAVLLVDGLRNKQIAYVANKAENTVKVHRSRIMHKMAVTSIVELSQQLQMIGIVGQGDASSASPAGRRASIAQH